MDCLFILQIPVHDGDRKAARLSLIVTLAIVSRQILLPDSDHLDVELLVDDRHGLELLVPGLGAGAEVATRHDHCLEQQPVLHGAPRELVVCLILDNLINSSVCTIIMLYKF